MVDSKRKRGAESAPAASTAYTFSLPRDEWRQMKAVAALRGQTIRDFLTALVRRELAEAAARREFTHKPS